MLEPLSAWMSRSEKPADAFLSTYPDPAIVCFDNAVLEILDKPSALRTIGDAQLKTEMEEKRTGIKLSKLTPYCQVLYLQGPRANYTIGRSKNNDIVIPRQEVSKLHAMIMRFEDNTVKIKDVSTNGTLVNKIMLHNHERELTDKSIIEIAQTQMVFYTASSFYKVLEIIR